MNKTGRFDQDTIRALKKYLFFCGENPGKMNNNNFDGVAEQALITFLAKADSFGFGSIFDCIKVFLQDQGFNDAANERKMRKASIVRISLTTLLIIRLAKNVMFHQRHCKIFLLPLLLISILLSLLAY